jgi:hypothetical protein
VVGSHPMFSKSEKDGERKRENLGEEVPESGIAGGRMVFRIRFRRSFLAWVIEEACRFFAFAAATN